MPALVVVMLLVPALVVVMLLVPVLVVVMLLVPVLAVRWRSACRSAWPDREHRLRAVAATRGCAGAQCRAARDHCGRGRAKLGMARSVSRLLDTHIAAMRDGFVQRSGGG